MRQVTESIPINIRFYLVKIINPICIGFKIKGISSTKSYIGAHSYAIWQVIEQEALAKLFGNSDI
jgi:hypothetical protein